MTVHGGVLISGCWNRRDSLYTEVSLFQGVGFAVHTMVSSFQGVGIEEFHCTQWCSCVGIKKFHCIHGGVLISGCWNKGVPLYTMVSKFVVEETDRKSHVVITVI